LEKLAKRCVPASLIEIEVTESVILGKRRDLVHHSLKQLAGAGIVIALDDFGTGYASLSNVKRLPISMLKIDREFVNGIGRNQDDAIVQAVATMGARMGLKIVAEGIETVSQLHTLQNFGVPEGQGMLFSPAVPAAQMQGLTEASTAGRWASLVRPKNTAIPHSNIIRMMDKVEATSK